MMFEPLTDQDLARLNAKFVVPIVVDQMLREQEPLDDVAEHAMNEIIAELCPDTALLCIAMCASHIARATAALPISRALAAESRQIIGEYAPLWLAHEKNPGALDDEMVRAALAYIPEDFEALRDLLEATMAALDEDHCIAAILCDILSLQADCHRDIAEAELQALALRPRPRPPFEPEPAPARLDGAPNVIPFPAPGNRRRQSARP